MKTLRMFGMALFAILMSVNFASCNSEEIIKPSEPQKCTISLGCVGEILEITNKPISKATESESESGLYTFKIIDKEDSKIWAEGSFKSIENLTVDLLENKVYRFEVTYEPENTSTPTNEFDYTLKEASNINIYNYYVKTDAYYGLLSEYTAIANGIVEIYMKRMSFGLNVAVEDLSEGASVTVNLYPVYNDCRKICELTNSVQEYDAIYVFDKGHYSSIYKGIWDNDNSIYVNYYTNPTLEILLKRTDGKEIVLATEQIMLERNKKTYIKIKIGQSDDTTSGEFDITFEEEDMEDGKGYDVDGDEGTIIETTINTETE